MPPLDLSRLKVFPLSSRRSLTRATEILIDPDSEPLPCSPAVAELVAQAAADIQAAQQHGASIMLIYGAHLLRNGAALILERMMDRGWVTHLATNGAGTIHDWEYAWFGESTESVQMNVADGSFGAWHETAWHLHLAMMAGALHGEGYGRSLGRMICEDGLTLPTVDELTQSLSNDPRSPLSAARADLLQAMLALKIPPGRMEVQHRWKQASIVASAFRHDVPLTVHPGIGYDIISNHPIFNGAVIGRAAGLDFKTFGGAVEKLDHGVVLSIGSAIMGPQVFEKSLSCVNNLRLQDARPTVHDHSFYVVDLQDGGGWDWTTGEPPKTNAAYYLRFCKSFSRMGGTMHYVQSDNLLFIHHLYHVLQNG